MTKENFIQENFNSDKLQSDKIIYHFIKENVLHSTYSIVWTLNLKLQNSTLLKESIEMIETNQKLENIDPESSLFLKI